jgi:hypothetical protein
MGPNLKLCTIAGFSVASWIFSRITKQIFIAYLKINWNFFYEYDRRDNVLAKEKKSTEINNFFHENILIQYENEPKKILMAQSKLAPEQQQQNF